MNEVDQEAVQGHASEYIRSVSINSIQFNKNHSVPNANLKMSAGQSSITIPYKIDTGTDGTCVQNVISHSN